MPGLLEAELQSPMLAWGTQPEASGATSALTQEPSLQPLISVSLLLTPYCSVTNSSHILSKSGERGHPCLLSDLERDLSSFLHLGSVFALGFLHAAFVVLRYGPSRQVSSWMVVVKSCWVLSQALSVSAEAVVISIIDAVYTLSHILTAGVEPPCHP